MSSLESQCYERKENEIWSDTRMGNNFLEVEFLMKPHKVCLWLELFSIWTHGKLNLIDVAFEILSRIWNFWACPVVKVFSKVTNSWFVAMVIKLMWSLVVAINASLWAIFSSLVLFSSLVQNRCWGFDVS